jgi:hypothetical protein
MGAQQLSSVCFGSYRSRATRKLIAEIYLLPHIKFEIKGIICGRELLRHCTLPLGKFRRLIDRAIYISKLENWHYLVYHSVSICLAQINQVKSLNIESAHCSTNCVV